MADVYDVKAMDISGKLYFRVLFEIGGKHAVMPAKMDFFFEIQKKEKERIEDDIVDYDWSPGMELVDRGWIDAEGNELTSVKYISLEQKRHFIKTYDELYYNNVDIAEEKQWIQHHGHQYGDFMQKPLYFDIEVDPTGLNSKMDSGSAAVKFSNRVLMVGMAAPRGVEYPYIDDDERKMLRVAYATAKKYSVLIGWNSGGYSKSFDIPYLQGRSEILGLKLAWDKIPHLDMMHVYKDYMKFKKELGEVVHLGLDDAGEKFLGYGKTETNYHKLVGWFMEDRLSLETYCMNDVFLMLDLAKKVPGLADGFDVEVIKRRLATLEPNNRYVSSFVDSKFNDIATEWKLGIPPRGRWVHRDPGKVCPFCDYIHEGDFDVEKCAMCNENIKKTGAGGLVIEPKKGLDFNTIFVDYESLYPTIYMTHNIGVNTVDWDGVGEDTIKTEELDFFKEPRGLNAEFMGWMLVERRKYRNARDEYVKGTTEYIFNDMYQAAFKDILVSANGVLEQKNFRYKNQKIYNSCTKTGQIYLEMLLEAGEELGLKLKQCDTDGIHFLSPYDTVEETIEHLKEIETHLYESVKKKAMAKWNIPEEMYAIYPRCEKICSHFYSIAKKSYIMRIVYDDGKEVIRFDAKGMPGVKYNTLTLLKEILKNIFKEVIFKLPAGADYVDACVDYLLALKDDLYSGRRDDLLMFSQQVDKLGGRNPWDRAAEKLDEMGKFEPGAIIKFIRRKNGSIILTEHEEVEVDLGTYEHYWTGSVAGWIKRLLPVVAGMRELGFEEAMVNDTLSWLE